jgi:hypothetical protein
MKKGYCYGSSLNASVLLVDHSALRAFSGLSNLAMSAKRA